SSVVVLVRDGLELLKARSQRQDGTILPVEARQGERRPKRAILPIVPILPANLDNLLRACSPRFGARRLRWRWPRSLVFEGALLRVAELLSRSGICCCGQVRAAPRESSGLDVNSRRQSHFPACRFPPSRNRRSACPAHV